MKALGRRDTDSVYRDIRLMDKVREAVSARAAPNAAVSVISLRFISVKRSFIFIYARLYNGTSKN